MSPDALPAVPADKADWEESVQEALKTESIDKTTT